MKDAVQDNTAVPLKYESRLIKISLDEEKAKQINELENKLNSLVDDEDTKAKIKRVDDENDDLEFIIACDMWLTGFDAPLINTMYFDKKIKMHSLIQAISRANIHAKDKNGYTSLLLASDLNTNPKVIEILLKNQVKSYLT